MLDIKNIPVGTTIYYIDYQALNHNPIIPLVVDKESFNSNRLVAKGKQGHFTINLVINDRLHESFNNPNRPRLFSTREGAEQQVEKVIQKEIKEVLDMSGPDVLQELYSSWVGEHQRHHRVSETMKKHIEQLFGLKI